MAREKAAKDFETARADAGLSFDARSVMSPLPRRGTVERREHPLAREFARMLNNYRRRKGLSIPDLAQQSGIPENDVRRFERATHAPDIHELIRLAEVFGVPAWQIAKRIQERAACLEQIDAAPLRVAT